MLLVVISVHLGTKVVEVRATDADDPTTANGELRYSLIQDLSAFQIDSITGTLLLPCSNIVLLFPDVESQEVRTCTLFFSLFGHESGLTSVVTPSLSVCLCHCLSAGVISCKIHTLDRETKSQYVVVVKAQDMRGMASGSTATTSVSITITDTNDNRASFIRSKEQIADVNVKTNRATTGNVLKGAFLGTLQ